jgi:hypothetical protein
MVDSVGPIIQVDFNGDVESAVLFRDWIASGDYLGPFAEWCLEKNEAPVENQT